MINRWIIGELKHKLAYRRGVHLTGARQVGKSTLAEMVELRTSEMERRGSLP